MKKKFTNLFLTILLILIFITVYPDNTIKASESIVYIDDDNKEGPWDGTQKNPFLKIQDGINSVSKDGIIHIFNGTYYENIVIDKTIKIKGSNRGNVILDGSGSGDVILVNANNITLNYLTIKNGLYGIKLINSSNCIIKNNTIKDSNNGIYLWNSSNNTIYHNNFINNNKHAYETKNNTWDNGYPSGGNYWDDYNGEDVVYNISGGTSKDRYPSIEYINELPAPDFTFSPLVPTTQDTIQFIDDSADSDGYIISWSWNFGDGHTSNQENPSHRYVDDGNYIVTLEVKDELGVSTDKSYIINVLNIGPTADMIYNPLTPTDLDNINFTDKSFDLDGYITSWLWDFGDGNTSNLTNPSHKYGDNGKYDVTLRLVDDDVAGAVIQKQIIVLNVAPTVGFTYNPKSPNTNDTVQLLDISKDLDGKIVSWSWDLGDGTTSDKQNPTVKYSYGGSYKVTLTVVDDDGDSSTVSKRVRISEQAEIHEDYTGWIVVLTVFIIIFVLLIGAVFYITKRFQK